MAWGFCLMVNRQASKKNVQEINFFDFFINVKF